jgi:hypothetical protein
MEGSDIFCTLICIDRAHSVLCVGDWNMKLPFDFHLSVRLTATFPVCLHIMMLNTEVPLATKYID